MYSHGLRLRIQTLGRYYSEYHMVVGQSLQYEITQFCSQEKNIFGVKDICSEKVHLLKFETLKQNITRCLTFLCGTNISIPIHSDSFTGLTIICSTLKKVSLYLTFPFNRNKYLQMLSNFIWLILKMFLCYCALYYVLFYIG